MIAFISYLGNLEQEWSMYAAEKQSYNETSPENAGFSEMEFTSSNPLKKQ